MNATVLDFETITVADFLANGNGKTILLTGVSWEEYESLLRQFWEKTNLSFAYNNGRLEIMPKSQRHEEYSRFISKLVFVYCGELDLLFEERGTATFKRTGLKKGVEPDECFYVQNAEIVFGLGDVESEDFPAPDIAVEVDLTTDSLDKFPIYAALGVPELWIYDGKNVRFYQLTGGIYDRTETSPALLHLTETVLTDFLTLSQTEGQTVAFKRFREWLKERKAV